MYIYVYNFSFGTGHSDHHCESWRKDRHPAWCYPRKQDCIRQSSNLRPLDLCCYCSCCCFNWMKKSLACVWVSEKSVVFYYWTFHLAFLKMEWRWLENETSDETSDVNLCWTVEAPCGDCSRQLASFRNMCRKKYWKGFYSFQQLQMVYSLIRQKVWIGKELHREQKTVT